MKKLILSLLLISTTLFASSSYEMIDDAEVAFKRRVELIQMAKEEILVNYFIFDNDRTGHEVLALLRNKAREGVKVKVLIDAYFNSIPKGMAKHLMEEGVEIKNYAPFNLFRPSRWIKRMHNKLLVVDKMHTLAGSRNIQDEYYDRAKIDNFMDRDILMVSESVTKNSREYFNKLWNAKFSKPMKTKRASKKKLAREVDQSIKILDGAMVDLQASGILNQTTIQKMTPSGVEIKMIFDPMKKKQSNGTAKFLYDLFENAKDNIIIETPYFVLTRKFMKAIKNAVKRGVKIRVMTNSLASTDAVISQAAYLNKKRKLLKMGVELYEFTNFDIKFHAKSFLIDYGTPDAKAVIGSYNFNARSHKQDTEMYAISSETELVEELYESMQTNLEMTAKVQKNGKLEGYNKRLPHTTLMKRITTTLMRFLLVPIIKSQI
jgi:putative cardiolipin synthase